MLGQRGIILAGLLALAACSTPLRQEPEGAASPAPDSTASAIPPPPAPAPIRLTTDTPTPSATTQDETAAAATAQTGDVWERIRTHLTLVRHTDKHIVRDKLGWYGRNQDYLDRVAERARPYLYYVVERLSARNMPLDLALLPVIESAYHPFARSPSHASGIWQFIPGTGTRFGLRQNWWYDGRRDIVAATEAALDYLQKLNDEFDGDWLLALAAYNSGELNVSRAIERNRKAGKPTDFFSLRLPRETRGYVPSLLAVAELVSDPDKYGVHLEAIPNQAYFAKAPIDTQLDLAQAARLADLSMDDLYTLNPGFNQWATDPEGPDYLLLPVDRVTQFEEALSRVPADERVSWKRHVIRQGESLGQIALSNHTSVDALRKINRIRGNLIRAGHSLLIPVARQPMEFYSLSEGNRRYRGLTRAGSDESYIYVIQRGDTLWDIGQQYGFSVAQICRWNDMSPRSVLHPGQKLRLRVSEQDEAEQSSTQARAIPVSFDPDSGTAVSYTVRKGDSLWLIAVRFGVSVAQLRKWNGLSSSTLLQPGQELQIFGPAKQATDA